MGKRVSTRKVKKHRHYTYEGAAEILGVSAQTVRSWRANLPLNETEYLEDLFNLSARRKKPN